MSDSGEAFGFKVDRIAPATSRHEEGAKYEASNARDSVMVRELRKPNRHFQRAAAVFEDGISPTRLQGGDFKNASIIMT